MLRPPPMHGSVDPHQSHHQKSPGSSLTQRERRPSSAGSISSSNSSKLASISRAAANAFMHIKGGFHDISGIGGSSNHQELSQLAEELTEERNRLRAELQECRNELQSVQSKYQFQLERLQKDCIEAEEEAAEARRELLELRHEFDEHRKMNLTELETMVLRKMQEADEKIKRQGSVDSLQPLGSRDLLVTKRLDTMEVMLTNLESAVGIMPPLTKIKDENSAEISGNNEIAVDKTADTVIFASAKSSVDLPDEDYVENQVPSEASPQMAPKAEYFVKSDAKCDTDVIPAVGIEATVKVCAADSPSLQPLIRTVNRKPILSPNCSQPEISSTPEYPLSKRFDSLPVHGEPHIIKQAAVLVEDDEWKSSFMQMLNRL